MVKESTMKHINVLVDEGAWITPYAEMLIAGLQDRGLSVSLCTDEKELSDGWLTFLLGFTRLVSKEALEKVTHNLVVHESALPEGKGFAPVAWQILAGKNSITVSLLEALPNAADAGDIWLQDKLELDGTELCHEWRKRQGELSVSLCLKAVDNYSQIIPYKQEGEESFYPRRRPADSELDVNASLASQFDLLRTVDNERYPAYFNYRGKKYVLTIEMASSSND